jgi:branched-chain amino acid transport system substrate-binding protein
LRPIGARSDVAAGAALVGLPFFLRRTDAAQSYPRLGTFPDGVSGNTAMIGIISDLTGSYFPDGEDLVRGYQLAIDHLNHGGGLVSKVPTLGQGRAREAARL